MRMDTDMADLTQYITDLTNGCSYLDQLVSEGSTDTTRINEVIRGRSEEHTSELQSRLHLVCRLLLEKKKKKTKKQKKTTKKQQKKKQKTSI